jgi:dolichol-phosphate mannosyltransferase
MVVAEEPAQAGWMTESECEQVGITLAWVADADGAGVQRTPVESMRIAAGADSGTSRSSRPPNLRAINDLIESVRPDACLLLGDGTLSRLVWVLADIENLPVFVLITTQEQLDNLTRRQKPKPDLFFIASSDLLPAALKDARYGSTLLAIGHPARDLGPFGPSPREARERLLDVIQRWWRGEIAPADPDLSIVVPAYCEAGNLPRVCERLIETIERDHLQAEILLVDDASPDETYAVALAQMWRFQRIRPFTKGPPRGMGNSIRHGLLRARAPIVAITMADGSDDVDRIPEMFRKVRDEAYGLAIGSRYGHPANYEAIPRLYRFWRIVFRLAARVLIGLHLRDYTNAFRVFRRSVFDRQGLEGGGFEISPEITFKAWFATRRVAEVDVKHLKRSAGQSSFSFLRAGPGYGKMLLKALICRVTGRWFVLDW